MTRATYGHKSSKASGPYVLLSSRGRATIVGSNERSQYSRWFS
jgi:hypothetical protein